MPHGKKSNPKPAKDGTKRGRPSDYNKSYITEVDKYLDQCEDFTSQEIDSIRRSIGTNEEGKSQATNKGLATYATVLRVKLPTRHGFARFIGKTKSTLDYWAADHPEFSSALEKIDDLQYERLVMNGLSGLYNSTIAKLLLSGNHGVVERKDVTSKDEAIGSVADVIAEAEEALEGSNRK